MLHMFPLLKQLNIHKNTPPCLHMSVFGWPPLPLEADGLSGWPLWYKYIPEFSCFLHRFKLIFLTDLAPRWYIQICVKTINTNCIQNWMQYFYVLKTYGAIIIIEKQSNRLAFPVHTMAHFQFSIIWRKNWNHINLR